MIIICEQWPLLFYEYGVFFVAKTVCGSTPNVGVEKHRSGQTQESQTSEWDKRRSGTNVGVDKRRNFGTNVGVDKHRSPKFFFNFEFFFKFEFFFQFELFPGLGPALRS